MNHMFDVVIIGAGSVGQPIAFSLAEAGFSVCVVEAMPGPGQGQNKAAIGGIRATHSDPAKIALSLESLDIFRNWEKNHGESIEWHQGGYSFPCYSENMETYFKDLLKVQKNFGLNINYISKDDFQELVPGINTENLRGGTFSPEDGSASPLKSSIAFFKYAKKLGVEYRFSENLVGFENEGSKITAAVTNKGKIYGEHFIIASGAEAREHGQMLNLDFPVFPDSHEAGITEPVERFFESMVVDIRAESTSKNYYFYQNKEGQVIFCVTPEPLIQGKNRQSTSEFLPLIAKRMISLFPKLKNLKVRRTWRGLYPMTPDGSPIVSEVREFANLKVAIGMCGQGYMLGPGIGRLFKRWFTNSLNEKDKVVLEKLTLYGDFGTGGNEALK